MIKKVLLKKLRIFFNDKSNDKRVIFFNKLLNDYVHEIIATITDDR